jgi:periplasmic protein TonB
MSTAVAAVSGLKGVSFRAPVLPWALSERDELRFRRILTATLGVSAVVCSVMLLLPRPADPSTQPAAIPPRVAKLMLEREAAKPVPPERRAERRPDRPVTAPPEPRAVPKAADPKPAGARQPEPSPKPAPARATAPEARNPIAGKPPGEEGTRQRAAGVGLLAMKDQLAELRGAPVAVQLAQDIPKGQGVGTTTGPGVGMGQDPGVPARRLITSAATAGSGGIDVAALSRDTGGGGLAGRATTLVEGIAGGGRGGHVNGRGDGAGTGSGAGGGSSGAGGGGGKAGGTLNRGTSGKASRSIEEIKLVFERHKGAIYAIYNRALREDPSLQGKVVLKLTIAPAGQITDLRIESSELKAAELEQRLLARIRQFDFGAKEVDVMVVTWPVDFLPS